MSVQSSSRNADSVPTRDWYPVVKVMQASYPSQAARRRSSSSWRTLVAWGRAEPSPVP